ncbi:hypothetical protein MY8738_010172 [Beauveria namnaoensis]
MITIVFPLAQLAGATATVTGTTERLVDNGIELQSGKSLAPSERAVAVSNTGEPPPSTRAATASACDTEAAVSGSARPP